VTIYRVVTVKRGARTFVAVDGGMGDNLEISLYGQRFEATVVDRVGGGEEVDLVGRHCESGDVLSAGVALREAARGRRRGRAGHGRLLLHDAQHLQRRRRPPVVFVRAGDARVVVRREGYDDLLRFDV
jgi:diaminopimelate decarboxylase